MPTTETAVTATALLIKATILAARWAGATRRRALATIARSAGDDRGAEVTFLRDRVEQLELQVAILRKYVGKHVRGTRSPSASTCCGSWSTSRPHVGGCTSISALPDRRCTGGCATSTTPPLPRGTLPTVLRSMWQHSSGISPRPTPIRRSAQTSSRSLQIDGATVTHTPKRAATGVSFPSSSPLATLLIAKPAIGRVRFARVDLGTRKEDDGGKVGDGPLLDLEERIAALDLRAFLVARGFISRVRDDPIDSVQRDRVTAWVAIAVSSCIFSVTARSNTANQNSEGEGKCDWSHRRPLSVRLCDAHGTKISLSRTVTASKLCGKALSVVP